MIELKCPVHKILERFRIEVTREDSMPPDQIRVLYRRRPDRPLSSIIIGENINEEMIKVFLRNYFEKERLSPYIISIRKIL